MRKQGSKSRQRAPSQSTALSREQLIHRIEMLREQLECNTPADTSDLENKLAVFNEQLKKYS